MLAKSFVDKYFIYKSVHNRSIIIPSQNLLLYLSKLFHIEIELLNYYFYLKIQRPYGVAPTESWSTGPVSLEGDEGSRVVSIRIFLVAAEYQTPKIFNLVVAACYYPCGMLYYILYNNVRVTDYY